MTITAKYPSKCAACGGAVAAGERIEWSKGSPARHTECPDSPSPAPAQQKRAYRPTTCTMCGHVERHDRRGYPIGDRVLRSGECQSCYEERKMGY